MNKKSAWIIVVIIVLLVLFFVFKGNKSKESVSNTEPVKIGLAVALTGYAANWGEGEVKAVELALDEFKKTSDRPVQLIIEDTESENLGTVNAMKKLIEVDHVQAIIGPTWGDSFQGGYPLANQAHVAVISPSAAFEAVENKSSLPYIFSTWWPQNQEAKALLEHIEMSGAQRIALVHDEDAFNTTFHNIFAEELRNQNKQDNLVSRTVLPIGTKDFRTHISKIKTNSPDVVVVLFQDTGSVGTFMKQLKEQGSAAKVYSTTSAENEDHLKKFPGLFEGILYSFPAYSNDERYMELKQEFRAKYGEQASEGPAFVNAHNAASMLFTALKNGANAGEEIKEELEKVKIPGIGSSILSFDKNGQIGDVSFMIKTVKNGKFVEVE